MYQIEKCKRFVLRLARRRDIFGISSLAGGELGTMEILKLWNFCYRHVYIMICFGIVAIILGRIHEKVF
jgi:hypothetical protein